MSQVPRDAEAMAETMATAPGGSFMEHRTRRERKFVDVESCLPDIKSPQAPHYLPSLAANLLSYLGSWNPLSRPVSGNDTVWLLDNTAYRNSKGEWEAEFVAAVFERDTGVEVSTIVADLAEKVGLGKGHAQEATIRERLMPFVQSIRPGRSMRIDFARKREIRLGPGGRHGISSDVKAVPSHEDGTVVSSVALVPPGANGILQSNTVHAEPEGWGVISGELRSGFCGHETDPLQTLTIPSRLPKRAIRSVSCDRLSYPRVPRSRACRNCTPSSKASSLLRRPSSTSRPPHTTCIRSSVTFDSSSTPTEPSSSETRAG